MKGGYSDFPDPISSDIASTAKIAIVTARFNTEITHKLQQGALKALANWGVGDGQIQTLAVPGAYELPLAAGYCLESGWDAVIAFGCVIRGETTHYDSICQSVERGLTTLQTTFLKPVVFGVLTTENYEQALDRVGGKHGHKGEEAAWVALRMLTLKKEVSENQVKLNNQYNE